MAEKHHGRPKSPKKLIQTLKVKVKLLSGVRLFGTPWTVAHQAPPSMGFSRQGYWSGLPFPSPGDRLDPGIEPWVSLIASRCHLVQPEKKAQCSSFQVYPGIFYAL